VSTSINAAAEAISQHIGGWQPQNGVDLDMFLSALPHLFESISNSISNVAATLGEQFPVDASVPERLREISASVSGMADHAGEAHAVHRTAHAAELERIENPRPNEQIWDVAENA
jgi:hypothetical protein